MQIILVKNNFKYISHFFKFNKTFRLNICNKNIVFYKYNNKNFCNNNKSTELDKSKSKSTEIEMTDINKPDFTINDLDLDNLGDMKQVTLKNYLNVDTINPNGIGDSSQSKLPTKIQKIGTEEVEMFVADKKLSKMENFKNYRDFLVRKEHFEKEYINHKMKIGIALFIFLMGLFSLWIPLYKTICETQGFSIKTNHVDYKFDGKRLNVLKKFTVKFIQEVDAELPWSFEPLQKEVVINAGETCLIFYHARNLTDEPIIGLSVYDVHPQALAIYFNKIQCFCFENQMLGPKEEVDLPVFFYIDPAINDAPELDVYREFVLKYSFYYAKKQDLAFVMAEHLKKEKQDREILNERKRELNKQGKNYKIEELDLKFTGLPGVNPALSEFIIQNAEMEQQEKLKLNESNYNKNNIIIDKEESKKL